VGRATRLEEGLEGGLKGSPEGGRLA